MYSLCRTNLSTDCASSAYVLVNLVLSIFLVNSGTRKFVQTNANFLALVLVNLELCCLYTLSLFPLHCKELALPLSDNDGKLAAVQEFLYRINHLINIERVNY